MRQGGHVCRSCSEMTRNVIRVQVQRKSVEEHSYSTDEKRNRSFLGRCRAKNPRSVKIWRKNRKLLVKRKLLRRVSLARRAGITIGDRWGGRQRNGQRKKKERRRFLGRESAKIGKRSILRFVRRSDSVYYTKKAKSAICRAWKSTTAFFVLYAGEMPAHGVSLIVRPFSQKHHFLYDCGMHAHLTRRYYKYNVWNK